MKKLFYIFSIYGIIYNKLNFKNSKVAVLKQNLEINQCC